MDKERIIRTSPFLIFKVLRNEKKEYNKDQIQPESVMYDNPDYNIFHYDKHLIYTFYRSKLSIKSVPLRKKCTFIYNTEWECEEPHYIEDFVWFENNVEVDDTK